METQDGSNPEHPVNAANAAEPKKRWWVIAAGAVAAAFLAAFGAWLFSRVSPILDGPFEQSALEVYVDDSGSECDTYALPASLLDDVPVVEVHDGFPAQLAEIDGEWIVEHGGLPTTVRRLELTLHGNGDETVVIHSIDVVDFEPLTPDEELVIVNECLPIGGQMDVSSLGTNFATRPPVLELDRPRAAVPVPSGQGRSRGVRHLDQQDGGGRRAGVLLPMERGDHVERGSRSAAPRREGRLDRGRDRDPVE